MHVSRIGFAEMKGTRHLSRPSVELDAAGPVGDRRLCLVDPLRGRVLRTVEHPCLLQAVVRERDGLLLAELPGGTVSAEVPRAGADADELEVDYWGRRVAVRLLEGPWSEAFSDHLGVRARLARVRAGGGVVYAGAVSLVGTGSVAALAARAGRSLHPARFRSTLVVDTGAREPHAEDGWVGRTLAVGEVLLRVTSRVPRCAVVDLDPVSGARDAAVLATLAGYRRGAGEIHFGVDAEVVRPGRVRVHDDVTGEGS